MKYLIKKEMILLIIAIYPISVLCYLSNEDLQVNIAHLTNHFFENLQEHPKLKNTILNESKTFIDKQVSNYISLIEQAHGTVEHSLTRRSLPIDETTSLTTDINGIYILHGIIPMLSIKVQLPKDICFFPYETKNYSTWYVAVLENTSATAGDDLVILQYKNDQFTEVNRMSVRNGVKLDTIAINDTVCIIVAENNGIGEKVYDKTQVIQFTPSTGQLKNTQFVDAEYASDVALWREHKNIFMVITTYMKSENEYEIKIPIFQWYGRHFDQIDRIKTYGAKKVTPFIIGSSHFLAVANFRNNFGNTNIYSEIFKYNRHLGKFESYQKILTKAAVDVKQFSFKTEHGAEHFLIFANLFDQDINGNKNYETESIVYKYIDGYFLPFQSFNLNGVTEWLPVVGPKSEFALLAACKFDGMKIFQYDGWKFTESEVQSTNEAFSKGIVSMRSYYMDTKIIVVVANKNDYGNMNNVFELKFTNKKMLSEFHDNNLLWCQQNLQNYKNQDQDTNKLSKRDTNIKDTITKNSIQNQELIKLKEKIEDYENEITNLENQIKTTLNRIKPNIIEGDVYVKNLTLHDSSISFESIAANSINNINISDFLSSVINITEDFQSEDVYEYDAVSIDSKINPKYINSHPLSDLVYVDKESHLKDLIVNGDVIFQEGLILEGKLNGIIFTGDNILLKDGNQSLSNLRLNTLSAELIDADFINDIDMSQVDSFNDQPIIVQNVNNLNVRSIWIDGLINNVDIPTLQELALKTFGNQTVTSKYKFDTLYVDNLHVRSMSDKKIPDELLLTEGARYTLNQSAEFVDKLAAHSVIVRDSVNNIDVIDEKLDVLLTDGVTRQHITGFKEFDTLELPNRPITLLGRINNAQLDAIRPVKTFNKEINIQGDYFIHGDVNVESMLMASDIQSSQDGLSVTKLQREGIKINKEKIPVHLEFSQQLNVEEIFCDTVNGIPVESFVIEGLSEPQVITGPKKFLDDVFITGNTKLVNVNGINIPSLEDGVLKISGNQTITGNLHIENVYAHRVFNVKTKFGDYPWEDVVNLSEDQVIRGTVVLENSLEIDRLEANSILCNSLINDYNFTFMVEDTVFRNQTLNINGLTQFNNLMIENLTATNIDLNALPAIIEDSKVIFEYDENVQFLSKLNVESIHFSDYFNGISVSDFGNKWLRNAEELYLGSDQTFNTITIHGNLYIESGFLDNTNITALSEDSVKIDEPTIFQSVTFPNGLASSASITLDGQFESLDLNDIVRSYTKDSQVILDQIVFNEDLFVYGEIIFNGLISGFNLTKICEFYDSMQNGDSINLQINGNAYFVKGPKINFINQLSVKQILDSVWFNNQDALISGEIELDTIFFEDDVIVDGFVDDVKVPHIAQTYFSKTKDQNITAIFNFDENVLFYGGVFAPTATVRGKIGGIHLGEFLGTALLNNWPQVFENMLFLDTCEVYELHGEYLVNDLDLQNDVMMYDRNNVITAKKIIKNVKTYTLKVDNNVFVQNVQLMPWIMNSVLKSGTFRLPGLVTLLNQTSFRKGIHSQKTINNFEFNHTTVMLRSIPQYVPAPKYFTSMDKNINIKALIMKGLLNGVDMTDLLHKQAYSNSDVVFESAIYFNGSISTPNVHVEKLYQGVNVTQLMINLTNFASFNNYTANFNKLLDISNQVVDSLQDHAYFINYYKVKQVYQMIDLIIPVAFESDKIQHLACIVKGDHKYTTTFEVWDSNAEFFRKDSELPLISTDSNLRYIKELKFKGRDHWYMEHERTTHLSTQNKYEGSLFEITRKGLKQIVPAILHNGTVFVTSLDLPMLNKCIFMLFNTQGSVYCEVIVSQGIHSWEDLQVMETSNSIGGTISIVNNITYIFIINAGTLNEPANVDVWKYNNSLKYFIREQTIYVSYPTSISTIFYKDSYYIAIASGYPQNTKYAGMITIRKYEENKQYFVKWQDIPLNVPIQVLFAQLPTNELILYVSTNNPTQPLIMYQYEGISQFVKKIVATTIPHSSQIKSFTTPDNRHFVLAKNGNETSVIEGVFKGQKNV